MSSGELAENKRTEGLFCRPCLGDEIMLSTLPKTTCVSASTNLNSSAFNHVVVFGQLWHAIEARGYRRMYKYS